MDKIRVLCLPSDKFGVGYFRSLSPHVNLHKQFGDVFDVVIDYEPYSKNEEFFKSFDIVHFSKNIGPSFERGNIILDFLKKNNIVSIMDIDDYWDLGSFHPMSRHYAKTAQKDKLISNIRKADYITTTTDIFADKIRQHNPNVFVLPNAIDTSEKQFIPNPIYSDKIRFGIICGSSHEHDINLLRGLTNMLSKDVLNKCQFVLCGFDLNGTITEKDAKTGQIISRPIKPQESVWYKYEKILTDDYKLVSNDFKNFLMKFIPNAEYPYNYNEMYRRCWTKNIHQYATHYNNIDVLLAPLKECDFNKYKSQLKVIEAGFFKKAIIAENFGPYTIDCVNIFNKDGSINENGNSMLVDVNKNHKQWHKYITRLVNEPELIKTLQNNLYNTVKDKYSIESVTKDRAKIYQEIIANKKE